MAYSNTPRGKRQKKLHEAELNASQSKSQYDYTRKLQELYPEYVGDMTKKDIDKYTKEDLKKYQHNLELVKKAAGKRAGR